MIVAAIAAALTIPPLLLLMWGFCRAAAHGDHTAHDLFTTGWPDHEDDEDTYR